ncbi:hypothetical protein Pcinc_001110 [Petrolisthes cinctipes]|uniref:ISXO2-like transposase domain-containing protein n=1 Tax=Petrolisthes cinctipes TaxID=88211 RepID=A0AAE1GNW0_PETCI|nr:hypothetical protein Pcinc_001110 [Petrolisthes cinctipes]
MAVNCEGCAVSSWEICNIIYENNNAAIDIFQDHGVLKREVQCPKCSKPASLVFRKSDNRLIWRCHRTYVAGKKKRKRCNFYSAFNKGSFLNNSKLDEWKILGFVTLWVRRDFKHWHAVERLQINKQTSVDWRSMCSEVTINWFENQPQIGGPNIVVEIDETLITRAKYGVSRIPKQVWLFGGIERISKKRFVIPLIDEQCTPEKRSKDILIPYIIKYIRQGSIIYSDEWRAYSTLYREGFRLATINHSQNFVHPTLSGCGGTLRIT